MVSNINMQADRETVNFQFETRVPVHASIHNSSITFNHPVRCHRSGNTLRCKDTVVDASIKNVTIIGSNNHVGHVFVGQTTTRPPFVSHYDLPSKSVLKTITTLGHASCAIESSAPMASVVQLTTYGDSKIVGCESSEWFKKSVVHCDVRGSSEIVGCNCVKSLSMFGRMAKMLGIEAE
jgi:hypothetical protein